MTTYCPLTGTSSAATGVQAPSSSAPVAEATTAVPAVSAAASSGVPSAAAEVSTYEGAAVKFSYSANLLAAAAALLLL